MHRFWTGRSLRLRDVDERFSGLCVEGFVEQRIRSEFSHMGTIKEGSSMIGHMVRKGTTVREHTGRLSVS